MPGFGFRAGASAHRKRGSAGSGGGGGSSAPTIFGPDMPIVYQGDSITALNDDSGWIHWLSYYSYGRFALGAGARQCISGSEIAENNDYKDIMRTDRYTQWKDCVSSGQAALHAIGTNTLGAATPTAQLAALDTIWADMRAKGAAIIASTVLPSASNTGQAGVDTFNDYITARASDADILVVDARSAWGNTYVGNTDTGNLHPTTTGAQKYGKAGADALVAKGYELGASYGAGGSSPGDNLVLNWSFTGTGGTKAGSNSAGISGSVPNNMTLTNNSAGVSMSVSVISVSVPVLTQQGDGSWTASNVSVPAIQIDCTGTASAQATNSLKIDANISPGEAAGSLYEMMHWLACTATDGSSVPSGVTVGMLSNSATLGLWAGANTAAGAGTLGLALTGGIARTQATGAVQATGTNGILFQWRQNAGAADCRIVIAMPYFHKSERTAYSVPVAAHTNRSDWLGPTNGPRTSTATGNPAVFSISNGVALTGRPCDHWRGGGITLTYQWEKSPDKVSVSNISGATSLNYTPATGDGYVRRKETATNSMGTTVAYTEWSSNSI